MKFTTTTRTGGFLLPACIDRAAAAAYRDRSGATAASSARIGSMFVNSTLVNSTLVNSTLVRPRGASG